MIPLALHGTRAVLRDGDWLPRHAPIVMTILGPIGAEGDDLRSIANLRNKVRAAILGHCGEPELAASASAHSL